MNPCVVVVGVMGRVTCSSAALYCIYLGKFRFMFILVCRQASGTRVACPLHGSNMESVLPNVLRRVLSS
jgi:hypothetical protein